MSASFRIITHPAFVLLLIASFSATSIAQEKDTIEPKTATGVEETKETPSIGRFMRIRRNAKNQAQGMETSITRYVTKNGDGKKVTVDLIGVVHIGEQEYYEKLNELFT